MNIHLYVYSEQCSGAPRVKLSVRETYIICVCVCGGFLKNCITHRILQ